jgi:hypothetical protein
MAVLSMTPLMRAETLLGADGWASGSQTCRGMTPAFAENPAKAKMKAMDAQTPGIRDERMASKV